MIRFNLFCAVVLDAVGRAAGRVSQANLLSGGKDKKLHCSIKKAVQEIFAKNGHLRLTGTA